MPVSVENAISGPFTPNGVATSFAFDFKAVSASEVVVVDQDGAELSSALYSVEIDDDEGGSVTFSDAPEAADYEALYIVGDPAMTQPSDFDNAGPSFNPAALTRAFDRATIRDLWLKSQIDRAVKVSFGNEGGELVPTASSVIAFNAEGVLAILPFSSFGNFAAIEAAVGVAVEANPADSNMGQIITDALRVERLAGGGIVELYPRQTYTLSDLADQTVGSDAVHGSGRSYLPPGCTLIGNGAKLKAATAFSFPLIRSTFETLSTHIVTGPMTSGETVFQLATVGEATQFAVGDTVLWRLGDLSFDAAETSNWSYAYVAAVDTGTGEVTLDRGLSLPWDGTGTNNKHLRRVLPFAGKMVEDISFEGLSATITDHVSRGISVHGGWGVQLNNLRGRWCGATFSLQYCQDFHIGYAEARNNNSTGGPSNVYGRGISMAESRGRIDHLAVFDCYRFGAYIEAATDLTVGFFHDVVTNDSTVSASRHRGFYVSGNSRVHAERALFEGVGEFLTHEIANGGVMTFGEVRCVTSGDPRRLPVPSYTCERLELSIDDTEELYIGSRGQWWEEEIELTDSMAAVSTNFPAEAAGIVTECWAYFEGDATSDDITGLSIGRPSSQILVSTLIPASPTTAPVSLLSAFAFSNDDNVGLRAPNFGSGAGTAGWDYRTEAPRFNVTTASSGVSGTLRVRCFIVPNELA